MDGGRGDADRPPARGAEHADEHRVAGALREARLREERVRGAGVRRRRQRSRSGPVLDGALGRGRPRRDRAVHLPRVRRPRRRHVSRDRRYPCAPQHARLPDVGTRAGAAACRRPVRAPAGQRLAGGHAALSVGRSVRLHRAQPAVPPRQSGRAEPLRGAILRRRGPRRFQPPAGVPDRDAPRRRRPRARPVRAGRRTDRPRDGARVRRVPAGRDRPLHVHRRLSAGRLGRRHGAPEQHRAECAGDVAGPAGAPAGFGVARVLPRLERGADSPPVARAVRFRGRQSVR